MNSPSPPNPYESPRVLDQLMTAPPSADRALALRRVRDALCILAIPALWNYGCLFWPQFVGLNARAGEFARPAPIAAGPVHTLVATVNFFLLVGTFLALWFLALKVLDWIALIVHRLFGGETSSADWLCSMYHSLWTLVWASRLGAICFVGWLVLFYYVPRADRLTVSVLLGTAGHLIGVWVYGTVFFNWYRLRHCQNKPTPDGERRASGG
jgi:hypothetical protein